MMDKAAVHKMITAWRTLSRHLQVKNGLLEMDIVGIEQSLQDMKAAVLDVLRGETMVYRQGKTRVEAAPPERKT